MDVTFQELSYTIEEDTFGPVCGQLSSAAAIQITVALSKSGSAQENEDFTVATSSLIFQPGITISCNNIVVIDDSLLEMDETIILTLIPDNIAVQATGTTTVTIPNRNSMKILIIQSL